MSEHLQNRRVNVRVCAAVLSVLGAAAGLAQAQEVTSVETEGNPFDQPGRGPGPRTAEEAKKPVAEQNKALPAPTPAPPVPAPESAPATSPIIEGFRAGGKPWTEWARATGDWGGARTSLENAGLTIAGSFTLDWSTIFSGGASKRAYSRRFLDINGTLDLGKLVGWNGGTVYADFYHYSGITSNPVGDVQGTDALSTGRSIDQLGELWFQQTLFDGKLRIKAGKIDANVDFAFLPCATGFVSANGTWDPNLLGQPTYPDPATGVLAFVYPTENLYIGAGFFDGATVDGFATGSRGPATFFSDSKSSSWFVQGEAGLTWKSLGDLGAGQLGFGGWTHTGDFSRFDGGTERGTWGGLRAGSAAAHQAKRGRKQGAVRVCSLGLRRQGRLAR